MAGYFLCRFTTQHSASAQPPHCDVGDVLGEVSGGYRGIGSEGGGTHGDAGGVAGIWNELRLNSVWGASKSELQG